jgi:hypothetical protein
LVPEDVDIATDLYLISGEMTRLVTPGTANTQQMGFHALADDGEGVVFYTRERLSDDDTDDRIDIYRWDAATSGVTLVTPGTLDVPTFLAASADATRVFISSSEDLLDLGLQHGIYEASAGSYALRGKDTFESLSRDGTRLYFSTSAPFVPEDLDQAWDGYEWSADGFRLLSPAGAGAVDFVFATPDGKAWFVETSERLSWNDTDDSSDVYRIDSSGPVLVSQGELAAGGQGFSGDGGSWRTRPDPVSSRRTSMTTGTSIGGMPPSRTCSPLSLMDPRRGVWGSSPSVRTGRESSCMAGNGSPRTMPTRRTTCTSGLTEGRRCYRLVPVRA